MSLISKFRWFLAPSIFQAGVAFATLPLATLILGPQDYGAYAVVAAITGLASSIACLGSSYLLSQTFSSGKPDEIRQLVSQQTAISCSLSSLFAIILLVSWRGITGYFENLATVPITGFILSALGIVPSTIWAIALDVLTLDGRAKAFAQIVIVTSLVSAAALLLSLFVFDMGPMSLFVSGFVGASALGFGAVLSLRRYLERPCFSREKLQVFKSALSLTSANLIEAAYQPVERNLLAVSSGLASLGLYAHAQQYRTIVATATKALSRSVWPTTLDEARQADFLFPLTNSYWRFTYLSLSLIGLGFAALGDAFIGLLTHGKFVGAGAFAAMSITYLLVQNSGRPHTGLMYARGHAGPFARFSIVSSAAGLACAVIAIPVWGVWGAILSIFLQQIVMRVAIQRYAGRIARIPFQDGGVVVGFLLISAVTVANEILQPGLPLQFAMFVLTATVAAGYYRMFSGVQRNSREQTA